MNFSFCNITIQHLVSYDSFAFINGNGVMAGMKSAIDENWLGAEYFNVVINCPLVFISFVLLLYALPIIFYIILAKVQSGGSLDVEPHLSISYKENMTRKNLDEKNKNNKPILNLVYINFNNHPTRLVFCPNGNPDLSYIVSDLFPYSNGRIGYALPPPNLGWSVYGGSIRDEGSWAVTFRRSGFIVDSDRFHYLSERYDIRSYNRRVISRLGSNNRFHFIELEHF